jgi:hypothetical protein
MFRLSSRSTGFRERAGRGARGARAARGGRRVFLSLPDQTDAAPRRGPGADRRRLRACCGSRAWSWVPRRPTCTLTTALRCTSPARPAGVPRSGPRAGIRGSTPRGTIPWRHRRARRREQRRKREAILLPCDAAPPARPWLRFAAGAEGPPRSVACPALHPVGCGSSPAGDLSRCRPPRAAVRRPHLLARRERGGGLRSYSPRSREVPVFARRTRWPLAASPAAHLGSCISGRPAGRVQARVSR